MNKCIIVPLFSFLWAKVWRAFTFSVHKIQSFEKNFDFDWQTQEFCTIKADSNHDSILTMLDFLYHCDQLIKRYFWERLRNEILQIYQTSLQKILKKPSHDRVIKRGGVQTMRHSPYGQGMVLLQVLHPMIIEQSRWATSSSLESLKCRNVLDVTSHVTLKVRYQMSLFHHVSR